MVLGIARADHDAHCTRRFFKLEADAALTLSVELHDLRCEHHTDAVDQRHLHRPFRCEALDLGRVERHVEHEVVQ
jgi:hypothetical protein